MKRLESKTNDHKSVPASVYSTSELERLLAACQLQEGSIGEIPAAAWWTGIIVIMLATGHRRIDVLRLAFDSLDLDAGEIRALGLVHSIAPIAVELLAPLTAINRPLLFPGSNSSAVQRQKFRSQARRLLRHAGLPLPPRGVDVLTQLRSTAHRRPESLADIALNRIEAVTMFVRKRIGSYFGIRDLERILGACRVQRGFIAGIDAADWWSALVATSASTGLLFRRLLQLPPSAVQIDEGVIVCGNIIHWLSPLALEFLRRIMQPERERLFPWNRDQGISGENLLMLRLRFQRIVRLALPRAPGHDLFGRLRRAAKGGNYEALFKSLDKSRIALAADNAKRSAAIKAAEREAKSRDTGKDLGRRTRALTALKERQSREGIYQIDSRSDRALVHFYEQDFERLRLANASDGMKKLYRLTIDHLRRFNGADFTLDQLRVYPDTGIVINRDFVEILCIPSSFRSA